MEIKQSHVYKVWASIYYVTNLGSFNPEIIRKLKHLKLIKTFLAELRV